MTKGRKGEPRFSRGLRVKPAMTEERSGFALFGNKNGEIEKSSNLAA
jgi:hypothetical protein